MATVFMYGMIIVGAGILIGCANEIVYVLKGRQVGGSEFKEEYKEWLTINQLEDDPENLNYFIRLVWEG